MISRRKWATYGALIIIVISILISIKYSELGVEVDSDRYSVGSKHQSSIAVDVTTDLDKSKATDRSTKTPRSQDPDKSIVLEKGISRIILKGSNGSWYRCSFSLAEMNTGKTYLFPGTENGIIEISSVQSGSYRFELTRDDVFLDARYGSELVIEIDQSHPRNNVVFVTSNSIKELTVEGDITVNGLDLKNAYVVVNWRGQRISLKKSVNKLYIGKKTLTRETKPGRAKITVEGLSVPRTVFWVEELSYSKAGKLTFRHNIELPNTHTIDINGLLVDGQDRKPIPNTRIPARFDDKDCFITTDAKGRFLIEGVLSSYRLSLYNRMPNQTLLIRQTNKNHIQLSTLQGQEIEIVRWKHRPTRLVLDKEVARLFAGKNIELGSVILIPLSSSNYSIDAKKIGMSTFNQSHFEIGYFEMRPLPLGEYFLVVSLIGQGTFSKRFKVTIADPTADIKIEMEPIDTKYSFTVFNNGRPAEGAIVIDGVWPHMAFKEVSWMFKGFKQYTSLFGNRNRGFRRSGTVVNAKGKGFIERSNSLNSQMTVFTKEGRCFQVSKKNGAINLEEHKGTVVSGIVFDNDGNPLKNVQVQLTSLNGGENNHSSIRPSAEEFIDLTTDKNGYYEISGIIPGRYLLSLCFSTSNETSKGVVTKHYQVDKDSFKILNVNRSMRNFNIQMTRSVKRCSSCNLYHTEKH